MIRSLKRSKDVRQRAQDDAKLPSTVESIITDIQSRSDVRGHSRQFDNRESADSRRSQRDIEAARNSPWYQPAPARA